MQGLRCTQGLKEEELSAAADAVSPKHGMHAYVEPSPTLRGSLEDRARPGMAQALVEAGCRPCRAVQTAPAKLHNPSVGAS